MYPKTSNLLCNKSYENFDYESSTLWWQQRILHSIFWATLMSPVRTKHVSVYLTVPLFKYLQFTDPSVSCRYIISIQFSTSANQQLNSNAKMMNWICRRTELTCAPVCKLVGNSSSQVLSLSVGVSCNGLQCAVMPPI